MKEHFVKGLPRYFVIKRNTSNPLWQEYIDWLNEIFWSQWEWGLFNYYWFDWFDGFWWTYCRDMLSWFHNKPTLITLQEWNEAVNWNKPKYTKQFERDDWVIFTETEIWEITIEDYKKEMKKNKARNKEIKQLLKEHKDLFGNQPTND